MESITQQQNISEANGLYGRFTITHRDADGNIKAQKDIDNTVTNAGLAEVASLILTDDPGTATAFDYIAIGTGTTAADATDTTLETEITTGGGSRAAGTGTLSTTTVTDDTAELEVTFSFTSSFAVTESGVFNAASAGTMLARQVFSAINVANGDSLTITWKITFS